MIFYKHCPFTPFVINMHITFYYGLCEILFSYIFSSERICLKMLFSSHCTHVRALKMNFYVYEGT